MESADRNAQAKVPLRKATTELEAPVVLTLDQLEKVAAGFTPGRTDDDFGSHASQSGRQVGAYHATVFEHRAKGFDRMISSDRNLTRGRPHQEPLPKRV